MHKKNWFLSGVTLIELLVAIAILSVLLTIAAPSFQSFITNNRVDTFANNLFSSFILAKSEAIKRNKRVMVCRSSTGTSCTGNWNEGWLVFVDADKNGLDADDPIIQITAKQEGSFGLSGLASDIYYDSLGRSSTSGALAICPPAPAPSGRGKALTIGATGMPSISTKKDCS